MRAMNHKKTSLAVAAALALGSASAVHAEIGFKAGAWGSLVLGQRERLRDLEQLRYFGQWSSREVSPATTVPAGSKEQAIESRPAAERARLRRQDQPVGLGHRLDDRLLPRGLPAQHRQARHRRLDDRRAAELPHVRYQGRRYP